MAEHPIQDCISNANPQWGAIWAGVFTFFAIWSVFGLLGLSVLMSAANPNNAAGVNAGTAIWAIILTIVAMYVAGRTTAYLAGISNAHDGMLYGTVMFGLLIVMAMAIIALSRISLTGPSSVGDHSPYPLGLFAGFGWLGFISLLLGWLAAMGGASIATVHRTASRPVHQTNHAA